MLTTTGTSVVKVPPLLTHPRRPLVGPFPKRYVQTYCFGLRLCSYCCDSTHISYIAPSAQQGLKHK